MSQTGRCVSTPQRFYWCKEKAKMLKKTNSFFGFFFEAIVRLKLKIQRKDQDNDMLCSRGAITHCYIDSICMYIYIYIYMVWPDDSLRISEDM